LKLENITTESLTSAFKKAGIDTASLAWKNKEIYDKYSRSLEEIKHINYHLIGIIIVLFTVNESKSISSL
jgi:hypothetical protein